MRKLLFLSSLLLVILWPAPALAQSFDPKDQGTTQNPSQGTGGNTSSTECGGGLQLGVPLGGLTSVPKSSDAFRCYVIGLYKYIIGLAVVLAAIVSTWAGYIWLTSGGDPARITHARELIIGALSGLALLLLASTVLRLIGIGSS